MGLKRLPFRIYTDIEQAKAKKFNMARTTPAKVQLQSKSTISNQGTIPQMYITRVVINNYRCLQKCSVDLDGRLNIIVGNNECGKSTFLEAINLALTSQINGRSIQSELHPYLFNTTTVSQYIEGIRAKTPTQPPSIQIELYFNDDGELTSLKGTNNSRRENVPGVCLSIEYNSEYSTEYTSYISTPDLIRTVPVEYYKITWRNFAGNDITSRSVPFKPSFIDASTIRNDFSTSRYMVDLVKGCLDKKQQVDLALTYRMMKDRFLDEDNIKAINQTLAAKRSAISDKTASISLDTSSRASWESGIIPHLDNIPLPLIGKGEQNSVKINLAMESTEKAHIFLIEEPENHLSFTSLNVLIKNISERRSGKQVILTTHSSFVLNKLGVESVFLFKKGQSITLKNLSHDTHDYFIKLPGHETLRLILANRAILVEGPSDELIVQKAFYKKHGRMPLEGGVDVITVNSLAFKRFLEIATLLGIEVDVVTDNDKDVSQLEKKYVDYMGINAKQNIRINFDRDENVHTLEPQLLNANSLEKVNAILGTTYQNVDDLLDYMQNNKTECALRFFETDTDWTVPEYINHAIGQ